MNNDSTSHGNMSHPQEVTSNDYYELVDQQVPSSTQIAESGGHLMILSTLMLVQ